MRELVLSVIEGEGVALTARGLRESAGGRPDTVRWREQQLAALSCARPCRRWRWVKVDYFTAGNTNGGIM